jgi:bifunctional ADP-heptose synthase (sugar kinase/adenylyltransferase)
VNPARSGWKGSKLVEQEALDVFVADTSGAGDAFAGAFAFAHLHGWPLEKAVPFANAAAGLVCRSIGARSACPPSKKSWRRWTALSPAKSPETSGAPIASSRQVGDGAKLLTRLRGH